MSGKSGHLTIAEPPAGGKTEVLRPGEGILGVGEVSRNPVSTLTPGLGATISPRPGGDTPPGGCLAGEARPW